MTRFTLLLAVASCQSQVNPAFCPNHENDPRCPDANPNPDAADAPSDGPPADARACFGGGAYVVCLDSIPSNTITINSNIDTSTASSQCLPTQPGNWTTNGQPDACFVVGRTVTISSGGGGNGISARGPRPLVVLATETLSVTTALSAAATRDSPTIIPAGLDPTTCPAFAQNPTPAANGGGAGAGASFATLGGAGGTGNGATANPGGIAPTPFGPPTKLRAGCTGQKGGDGDTAGNGGVPGNGGGAIYLVAATISLGSQASINVSGAAGSGAGHHAGGGGAGSGGMIVIFADMLMVNTSAKLMANGGGGASGGTTNNGASGRDPSTQTPTTPATGATSTSGGNGGNGYAGGTEATGGTGGATNDGGAGGGGGGGYIQANQTLGVTASPPVVVVP